MMISNMKYISLLFITPVLGLKAFQEFPVHVQRRGEGDLVTVFTAGRSCDNRACAMNRTTYMLDDGSCHSDTEILSKFCPRKSYLAVARGSFVDISVVIGLDGVLRSRDPSSGSYQVAQIFDRFGGRLSEANNCVVRSLSVIRSEDRKIIIDGRGFEIISSSHDLRVQVKPSQLAYTLKEYEGELFQMTFSCSHSSDMFCVVFKVNGSVLYWKGKFDNIIKQLPDTWDACPLNSASEQHMLTTSAEGHVNVSLLWSLLGSALGLILLALAISIVAYQIYIQHKKLSTERTANSSHVSQLRANSSENCAANVLKRSSPSLSDQGPLMLVQSSSRDPLDHSNKLWNILSKNVNAKKDQSQRTNSLDTIELVET